MTLHCIQHMSYVDNGMQLRANHVGFAHRTFGQCTSQSLYELGPAAMLQSPGP